MERRSMARHLQPILLNHIPHLFAALVILALVSVACSGSNPPATAEPSPPLSTVTNTVVPSPKPNSTAVFHCHAQSIPYPDPERYT